MFFFYGGNGTLANCSLLTSYEAVNQCSTHRCFIFMKHYDFFFLSFFNVQPLKIFQSLPLKLNSLNPSCHQPTPPL